MLFEKLGSREEHSPRRHRQRMTDVESRVQHFVDSVFAMGSMLVCLGVVRHS